jgi:hypothetical protein
MASKSNIQESQQQGQGITIGTQGNKDQPTPLGDDLHHQKEGRGDRHIPNQDRSSATNQERSDNNRE